MNDDNVVVRPADKGSGIVIINSEEQVKKVNEELSKNDTYKKIKDSTASVRNKIKTLLKDMHNKVWIDANVKKYMTSNFLRCVHCERHPENA